VEERGKDFQAIRIPETLKGGLTHMSIVFSDIDRKLCSSDINTFFNDWRSGEERVCILSPHDDDAIIGAGYAIVAAQQNGAKVYVYIFCRGNGGYTKPEEAESIEAIRIAETINAYKRIGVKECNILRFNYSDFSVLSNIGWHLSSGSDGSFEPVISSLRKHRITRLLIPNHYREHIDHTAVNMIGAYDAPQAGDPIVPDFGIATSIRSVIEYSVWAELSPEDMLEMKREEGLRANRIIIVPEETEVKICEGIAQYESQGDIIKHLISARRERRLESGGYIEVYISFNPRPKLNYKPYVEFLKGLRRK
jgi:LmbE family N-acetylglucosaminyl deacetylase